MSGSPDFLLNPLTSTFKQDYLICSELEVKCNFYTGELRGLHPYGKRKTSLLKKVQKKKTGTQDLGAEVKPGFVVTIAGYTPYENPMDLIEPYGVGENPGEWGFVTRLMNLDKIS